MSNTTAIKLGDGQPTTLEEITRNLRLNVRITEVTVSAGETFQKRQYEPKNYHLSVKLDLSPLWVLFDQVAPEDQPRVRQALAQIVREQIQSKDDFLHEQIRYIAQLDGCTAASADLADRRRANAHGAGAKAARAGVPSTSNPYAGRDDAYGIAMAQAWNEGWQSAQ